MKPIHYGLLLPLLSIMAINSSHANQSPLTLEEVTVTAQKFEQSLQDTPIAISVISGQQLINSGISSLDGLGGGIIPSLQILPLGSTPSTLTTTIRGNGPTDTTQVTREGSVAFYENGFYVARPQGLSTEMLNIERIEVLRGPQGTLFGRNAVAGAIHIINKAPTGQPGIQQLIGLGNYDAFRSVTHVDLPTIAGIKTAIDYSHSERDGWVDNTAPGQNDYYEYDKDGGRINFLWDALEGISVDYAYSQSDTESTQMYFQIYGAPNAFIDVENGRASTTRFDVQPLNPTTVDKFSHTLTASWSISDNITIKSLTSYSDLEQDTNTNWAGALGSFGFMFLEDIGQEQLSQEIQVIGKNDQLEWVAGIYYFEEDVSQDTTFNFSLQADLTPIIPPTSVHPVFLLDLPTSFVEADAESRAAYGQVTWEAVDNKLFLTFGARYTEDEKSGTRFEYIGQSFDFDSEHFDTTFIVDYRWTDELSAYVKRSTAYKAGGVSLRSTSFAPYEKEEVETYEAGFKSEFWHQRIRVNAAVFQTDYTDMQIDVVNPLNAANVETINAAGDVEVDGFEFEMTLAPIDGLVFGLNYTYLDGDMPLQPNPLAGGALQKFVTAQTPQHAGSFTADYRFKPWEFGTLNAHIDVTATDQYARVSYSPDNQRYDGYELVGARLTLSDINLGSDKHSLEVSLWGRNLTDEEYITFSFPNVQAFGTPRTTGLDVIYKF